MSVTPLFRKTRLIHITGADSTTIRATVGSHLHFNPPRCALFGITFPNQCFASLSVGDADKSLISTVCSIWHVHT